MMGKEYKEGELIKFKSPIDNTIINGRIRGIAQEDMPVIGRMFIVELIENPFPNCPYTCIAVMECSIITD